MIAPLVPYPSYKDSGIEWLAGVPEHWELHRLRTSVDGCVSGIWGNEPNGTDDVPCVRVADFDRSRMRVRIEEPTLRAVAPNERKNRLLRKGDLLMEKSGGGDLQPVGAIVLYDHDVEAVCSNFVARMPVTSRCDATYLTYLHSHLYATRLNIRSIKQTTGIQNLDVSSYLGEVVAFPPLSEQAAIARFLDHADRRIRRYVLAKQKLIAALEELKRAIIHRAVTGQIDVRTGRPYPAHKSSGAARLGRIPEHWNIVRLGKLIALQTGFPFKSEGFTQNAEDPRLLRGVNIAPGRLRWEDTVRWPATEADTAPLCEYRLRTGDIVLGMDRPVIRGGIRVAVVTEADVPSLLLQRVARIQPGPKLRRDFAFLLLSGQPFANYMAPIFTGISVPHLSPEQIKGFTVALPGLGEQDQILKALAPAIHAAQRAADRATRQIERMHEYRTRLIADVVTGKLDVREALPDTAPA